MTCLISIQLDAETSAIKIITQMMCFSVKKANFVVQREPMKKAAQRNADPMIQKVIYLIITPINFQAADTLMYLGH